MKSKKHLLALPAVMAAALLVPALPASAAGPDTPDEGPSYIPVGYACPDFNLGYTWTGGEKGWSRAVMEDGVITRIMGHTSGAVVTYINYGSDPLNPVAGKTYTVKMKGSNFRTDYGEGTVTITLTGDNEVSLSGPDIPGGVSTTLHSGRVVLTYNNTTGALEVVRSSGRELDLCAALR